MLMKRLPQHMLVLATDTAGQVEYACAAALLAALPAHSMHVCMYASHFQQAFSVPDFFTNSEPNACGAFVRECYSHRKSIVTT